MSNPYRIQEVHENGSLRLAWDNRRAPKQNGLFALLVVFWLVWAPVTVYMTAVIFRGEVALWFGVLWFVLGWLGTIAIPISFVSRCWSEWVLIAPTSISCGSRGFLAPRPKVYPIRSEGPALELAFGYLPSGVSADGESGDETMITLSLFGPSHFGFRKRILIGYWLAPTLKAEIFRAIKTYVAAHQVPLSIKTYGVSDEASNGSNRATLNRQDNCP